MGDNAPKRDYLPMAMPTQYGAVPTRQAPVQPMQVDEPWSTADKVLLVDPHGAPLIVQRPRKVGFGR